MTTTKFPEGNLAAITGQNIYGRTIILTRGSVIRFHRADGRICTDTVRDCFHAYVLVAPYGENYSEPAVVLTEHSWTRVADVVEVL